MGDTISGRDFECRYIAEGPYGTGNFSLFIKQLGISLPPGTTVRDAVRFGWIAPVARIAIPREYFEEWKEYPLASRSTPARPEHQWADWLIRGDFSFALDFPEPRRPLHRTWYLHPFDTDDTDVREIFAHAIPPHVQPAEFKHPRGGVVRPYVDLFRYWEAYRLMESLKAARLAAPIPNTPAAKAACQNITDHADAYIARSTRSIERVRRTYEELATAFESVSLYRTLLAAAVIADDRRPNEYRAAMQLLQRTGRTADALKDDVRRLLELWTHWQSFESPHRPAGAKRHLQQDIKRAVDFVETVTKTEIDYRDPHWYSADRNPRRWSELHHALPYEHWLAREEFPQFAAMYMRRARSFRFRKPVPITEEQFRSATDARWSESYGLRRFTILFKRLHDLLNSDRGILVTFKDHNVVDYMILGCLVVERMVTEWWRRRNTSATETPRFDLMLTDFANALTTLMGVRPIDALLRQRSSKAKLHALKEGDKLPLVTPAGKSGRQFILATLHNLRVLRNYSAHHDCLDYDLTYGQEGERAMNVMVSAVALRLALPD